jgi:hypothetical protein
VSVIAFPKADPTEQQRGLAKNKAQREWNRRRVRKIILAEAPISLRVRRVLVEDDWLSASESENKRLLGEIWRARHQK